MSGKATAQDIQDEGFTPSSFGNVAGGAWTTYITTLLTRASNWAQQRVTAVNYAASTSPGYAFDALVRAEIAYCAEVFWTRRKAFIDSSSVIGLQDDKRASQWKEAQNNALAAEQDMQFWIAEAQRFYGMDAQGDIPGTGLASGVVETGPYPQTDLTAVNYAGAQ